MSVSLQGSDEGLIPSEPPFLLVGRVLRPHSLRGEVRVQIHTSYPERFAVYEWLYLGPTYTPYKLESHRFHQKIVLLKLEGIDNRTQAETLREQEVWISIDEAMPLAEGECYLYEIIGMQMVTVEGETLGQIAEMIETGANDVFVVHTRQGELLVPDIGEVVLKIDVEAREIVVRLPEGLR